MQRERYTYSIHPHIAIENLNKMGKKNKFITSRLVFLDTRSGRDWVLSLWRNQMSHKAVEVSFGVRLLWRYYYSLYLLFVFWWGTLLFNLYLATQLCLWIIGWCYLIHVHKLLGQFVWGPVWHWVEWVHYPQSSLSKTRFRNFFF